MLFFFPLLAATIIQGAACCLIFAIYKKSKENFLWYVFLSSLLMLITCALVLFIPNAAILAAGIFAAGIPAIAGALFRLMEKKEESGQQTADTEQPGDEISVPITSVTDQKLLETSRDFVVHAADTISEESGLDRLLDFINQNMIKETRADGGVIFLVDDFDDVISVKSFSGDFPPPYKLPEDLPHKRIRIDANFRCARFDLGKTIFGEVASTGKGELITSPDARIFQNGPEEFLRTGSYIVVPLIFRDTVIGVTSVARTAEHKPFDDTDFNTVSVLASFAGAAINNVYAFNEVLEHADLMKESQIAGKMQKSLLPKTLPSEPGLSFGALFNEAEGVCGDFNDIIPARKDRISLVSADVAGKGMNSLTVMIMIRAILHLVVNTTKSAGTILDWVNRGITGRIDMDHFATLALLNYNSIDHTIEYASAGHNPMYLWNSRTKKMETVTVKSDPIGVERTTGYSDIKIQVSPGDIVVLYTDGLVEALNSHGHQYGTENLTRIVADSSNLMAKEIAAKVKADIRNFSGGAHQHDDQSLLIMKIQG